MSIEIEEPGVRAMPECWNLPEKSSYWSCVGDCVPPPPKHWWDRKHPKEKEAIWSTLSYTKEDAEANAFRLNGKFEWVWDGMPAREFNLSDAMRAARLRGRKGVMVESYIDGEWRVVKKYLAGVPLPMEERED